jgi:hypothetical protein
MRGHDVEVEDRFVVRKPVAQLPNPIEVAGDLVTRAITVRKRVPQLLSPEFLITLADERNPETKGQSTDDAVLGGSSFLLPDPIDRERYSPDLIAA